MDKSFAHLMNNLFDILTIQRFKMFEEMVVDTNVHNDEHLRECLTSLGYLSRYCHFVQLYLRYFEPERSNMFHLVDVKGVNSLNVHIFYECVEELSKISEWYDNWILPFTQRNKVREILKENDIEKFQIILIIRFNKELQKDFKIFLDKVNWVYNLIDNKLVFVEKYD